MTITDADLQPVILHCEGCQHEWPAAYLPLSLDGFARLLTDARCPACASQVVHFRDPRNHAATAMGER